MCCSRNAQPWCSVAKLLIARAPLMSCSVSAGAPCSAWAACKAGVNQCAKEWETAPEMLLVGLRASWNNFSCRAVGCPQHSHCSLSYPCNSPHGSVGRRNPSQPRSLGTEQCVCVGGGESWRAIAEPLLFCSMLAKNELGLVLHNYETLILILMLLMSAFAKFRRVISVLPAVLAETMRSHRKNRAPQGS